MGIGRGGYCISDERITRNEACEVREAADRRVISDGYGYFHHCVA